MNSTDQKLWEARPPGRSLPGRAVGRPSRHVCAAAAVMGIISLVLPQGLCAAADAIVLEAEEGTLVGTMASGEAEGFSGAGYVTEFTSEEHLVRWDFAVPTGGLHRLQIWFRTPHGAKGFGGELNGTGISGMFPATARFAEHDAGLVEVKPGANTLTIGGGWNYYEIDCVTLTPSDAIPPPKPVPATLVDDQATPAARALMAELVADYGKTTWSGQHELIELDHLVKTSGKKPVILSGDLMFYSPARVERQGMPGTFMPRDYLDALIDAVKNDGYVLSLCWHWDAPTNHVEKSGTDWYLAFRSDVTTFDVAAALTDPESAEYALLVRDIDAIAVQLKKVAAADIPVLWRPLHESEGGWFWWGAKGPDAFKKLWRLVYQRLTEHHDLHNLIWVLASEDAEWYPGDDVVDIVGADKYPPSMSDPLSSTWEGLKAQYDGRKLIALTETGGMPDIEKMHQFGVWWSFFIPWSSEDGPASAPDATVQRIYQSPGVLTLDERIAR